MEYLLLIGIIFFLVITLLVINYDKPSKKLNFSRYTATTIHSNPHRLKQQHVKGQTQKFSEINDLKLIPEIHYFKTNRWSIMFWIQINVPNKMICIQKGKLPMVQFDPPYTKFIFNTPSGKFETIDNLEQQTLKHFAWVQDGMELRIFENGKPYLISDPNQNFTQDLPSSELKINAHLGNINFRNFRLCNTAQTYKQITDIYKIEKPIITGEKYIEKKLIKDDLRKALKRGEIYSPDTGLKKIL
jgi:hypothetical protein